jgi:hypothetical protein
MDALIKALEATGQKVKPWESSKKRSCVLVNDEKILFRVKEGLRQVKLNPEEERSILAARYKPSGELRFRIWGDEPYATQREWTDSKGGPLERCLDQIFTGFFQAAVDRKAGRAGFEEAARLRAEEEQRAWEREQKRRRERERVEALRKDAVDWEEAQRLRNFVAATEKVARASGAGTVLGRPIPEWVAWAGSVAAALDPLLRPQRLTRPSDQEDDDEEDGCDEVL